MHGVLTFGKQMKARKLNWILLLNKEYRLYRHLLFWALVILWSVVFKQYPQHFNYIEIVCFMAQWILTIATPAYINNYLVLPFFNNKKFIIAITLFIVQIVLLSLLLPVLCDLIQQLFMKLFQIQKCIDWHTEHLAFKIIGYVAMASIFKYAKDSLLRSQEQKETELRHLKSQLNPHFLFNTLNNLYGLAAVKSDKLPPLMLKLSELLRYSVYDTEQTFVQLEKELTYLKNYVELEKIRLNEGVTIEFNQSGDFSNQQIAPLMLIVFVENSFKHFSYKRNESGFININLNIHENILSMSINNSIDSSLYAEIKKGKGIGLSNVQKRLNMLYPKKHYLEIIHQPNFYEIHLKIDLSL